VCAAGRKCTDLSALTLTGNKRLTSGGPGFGIKEAPIGRLETTPTNPTQIRRNPSAPFQISKSQATQAKQPVPSHPGSSGDCRLCAPKNGRCNTPRASASSWPLPRVSPHLCPAFGPPLSHLWPTFAPAFGPPLARLCPTFGAWRAVNSPPILCLFGIVSPPLA